MKLKVDLIIYLKCLSDFEFLKVTYKSILDEAVLNSESGIYVISINFLENYNKIEFELLKSIELTSKIYIGYWMQNDYGGFTMPEKVTELSFKYKIPIEVCTYIYYNNEDE